MSDKRADLEQEFASLFAELHQLARRGFREADLVDLARFPTIVHVTGVAHRDPGTRAAELHALLKGAIARLPASDQAAATLLTGLDPEATDTTLAARRSQAAEALGVATETFRTHREGKLLERVGQALLVQVSAHAPTSTRNRATPNRVFVIHGRNAMASRAIFSFLRSLRVEPVEWSNLVARTASPSPNILDVLRSAIESSSAIIALLAPESASGQPASRESPGQPSSNVLIELGLALGVAPSKTIVATVGNVTVPSDLAGAPVIRLSNAASSRDALRTRLRLLGCEPVEGTLDWLDPATSGDFDAAEQPRSSAHERDRDDHESLQEFIGDRFDLVQRLATGLSGARVWAARDRLTGDRVVLKVWPRLAASSRQQLHESAARLAEIEHPGLVPIRAVLERDNRVAVAAETVDGVPLDTTGRLSQGASLKLVEGLLRAVAELHSHGFVHGDINPANIVITTGGQPVLIDFDALNASAQDDPHRPLEEHVDRPAGIGPAVDVWSVGAILLDLLTGSGGSDRLRAPEEIIGKLDLSAELKDVLRRSLARTPEQRYTSAEEMLDALRRTPEGSVLQSAP